MCASVRRRSKRETIVLQIIKGDKRMLFSVFKEAKTYAVAFFIAALGILIATNNWSLTIKILVMLTYWLFINKLQINGGFLKRLLWNAMFLFTGAAILYLFDLSIPSIVLKLISKLPLIGKAVEIVAILIKLPEAAVWSAISVTFGWLAGILELEELPAFERLIILKIEESIRYR